MNTHKETHAARVALASSMPASLIEIVLVYCQNPNAEMSYRRSRMVFAGDESMQSTRRSLAMRKPDGSVATWGDTTVGGENPELKDVKAICSAWEGAFAAIVGDDNTVACWGDKDFGGDCSAVASDLKHVEAICGSGGAFAALKRDGTVTSWGEGDGGDSSSVQSRLKGVKAIYSTRHAFAAVLDDGTVETWGDEGSGGLIPPSVKKRLKQVQCISGSDEAFAALLSDGTVETWGSGAELILLVKSDHSDDAVEEDVDCVLTGVEGICASSRAFAVLRKNGTVFTWGEEALGGDSSRVQDQLKQVVAISSAMYAFAAVRSDGTVVTWGAERFGGDSSSVASELKEVVAVCGNSYAFAALRKDGTVVAWGHPVHGGDCSEVQGELAGVVSLSSSGYCFAAQRNDGQVVTWGPKGWARNMRSLAIRKCIQGRSYIELLPLAPWPNS